MNIVLGCTRGCDARLVKTQLASSGGIKGKDIDMIG